MNACKLLAVVILCLACFVQCQAQQMDSKTSARVLSEAFNASKQGNLAITYDRLYIVANSAPFSHEGGTASWTLGNYCLKAGRTEDALGWYDRATRSTNGKVAAQALESAGNVRWRLGDKWTAVDAYLTAKDRDPSKASTMYLKAARCYVAIAQANPELRRQLKPLAARLCELSGTDQSRAEAFGLRYEALLDADEATKQSRKFDISSISVVMAKQTRLSEPWRFDSGRDSWSKLVADMAKFEKTATDRTARATALLMSAEIYADQLKNPDKAIELLTRLGELPESRAQRAWGRLVLGGVRKDQGRLQEAAAMFASIVSDFSDNDNFARNNVRATAMLLEAQCLERLGQKAEANALRQTIIKTWPGSECAVEARRDLSLR